MQYVICRTKTKEDLGFAYLPTIGEARFVCNWIKSVHPEYDLEIWKKTKTEFKKVEKV